MNKKNYTISFIKALLISSALGITGFCSAAEKEVITVIASLPDVDIGGILDLGTQATATLTELSLSAPLLIKGTEETDQTLAIDKSTITTDSSKLPLIISRNDKLVFQFKDPYYDLFQPLHLPRILFQSKDAITTSKILVDVAYNTTDLGYTPAVLARMPVLEINGLWVKGTSSVAVNAINTDTTDNTNACLNHIYVKNGAEYDDYEQSDITEPYNDTRYALYTHLLFGSTAHTLTTAPYTINTAYGAKGTDYNPSIDTTVNDVVTSGGGYYYLGLGPTPYAPVSEKTETPGSQFQYAMHYHNIAMAEKQGVANALTGGFMPYFFGIVSKDWNKGRTSLAADILGDGGLVIDSTGMETRISFSLGTKIVSKTLTTTQTVNSVTSGGDLDYDVSGDLGTSGRCGLIIKGGSIVDAGGNTDNRKHPRINIQGGTFYIKTGTVTVRKFVIGTAE
jgi:hypothetical protein